MRKYFGLASIIAFITLFILLNHNWKLGILGIIVVHLCSFSTKIVICLEMRLVCILIVDTGYEWKKIR